MATIKDNIKYLPEDNSINKSINSFANGYIKLIEEKLNEKIHSNELAIINLSGEVVFSGFVVEDSGKAIIKDFSIEDSVFSETISEIIKNFFANHIQYLTENL